MENESQKTFTIELDRTELLDTIQAISWVMAEIALEKNGSDVAYGHLITMTSLNEKLAQHLATITEEH